MEAGLAPGGRLDLREPARRVAALELGDLGADPALVSAAIGTWRGRMVNEHGSARVFEALARQMREAGLAPEQVDTVAGFAEEERRHGVLCGAVVEAVPSRRADACARASVAATAATNARAHTTPNARTRLEPTPNAHEEVRRLIGIRHRLRHEHADQPQVEADPDVRLERRE